MTHVFQIKKKIVLVFLCSAKIKTEKTVSVHETTVREI